MGGVEVGNTENKEGSIVIQLQEIKEAIEFADNGSYFSEIRDELKALNKTLVEVADALSQMTGDKNPRNRPPVSI